MTEKLSSEELKVRCDSFDKAYAEVKERIASAAERSGRSASDIHLLAATKTVPAEVINHAVNSGIDLIGENRVQELCSKLDYLDPSAERHLIGHLQTNKVRQIVGKVSTIESVDSVRVAREIADRSRSLGISTDIFLEVNIGREENKSGFLKENLFDGLCEIADFDGVNIKGLMTIPPISDNIRENLHYFDEMQKLFIDISSKKIDNVSMTYLSMGMSGDFEQAILYGANIVRLGSVLFGRRVY